MPRLPLAYTMLAFIILAIAFTVVATPVPQAWVLKDAQLFTLRANW